MNRPFPTHGPRQQRGADPLRLSAQITCDCRAVRGARNLLCVVLLLPLVLFSSAQAQENSGHPARVGWLMLDTPLREGPPPYAWLSAEDAGPSLQEVLSQMDTVATGAGYRGLVLFLDGPQLSLSQISALRAGIARVRAAGRKVVAFAESYGLGDYLLAAACDQIVLQRKGAVELSGLAMEEIYLAGLLETAGIQADLIQIGEFKGADESMTRREPSEAWNQNIDALLDDLYDQLLTDLSQSRVRERAVMEALLGDAWMLNDQQLLRCGLVDQLSDRDLQRVTEVAFGSDFEWDSALGRPEVSRGATHAMAILQKLFQEQQVIPQRASLVVVRVAGPIHSGESTSGGGLFGSDSIGSRSLNYFLKSAMDESHVRGVVLSLDSPGGSALASEMIWQQVRSFGQHKPIYAVITGTAASGGYYIASAADEIYTAPTATVGSIGVVGGKLAMGGLYEKLGLQVTRRSRGPAAGLFNSVEPFTESQRRQVRQAMQSVYDQFVERVAIGRGRRLTDVEAVARGRLFTGRQAVALGMADHLGGEREAVAALAQELQLKSGEYDVIHLPEPLPLSAFLAQRLGASVQRPGMGTDQRFLADALRQVLGSSRWAQLAPLAEGLLLLQREPVLTLMPAALWLGGER